jgi:hypothetical protein
MSAAGRQGDGERIPGEVAGAVRRRARRRKGEAVEDAVVDGADRGVVDDDDVGVGGGYRGEGEAERGQEQSRSPSQRAEAKARIHQKPPCGRSCRAAVSAGAHAQCCASMWWALGVDRGPLGIDA